MSVGSVAAIIVNFRTKELTTAAARSVLDEPLVGEVLIIDNASGDDSVDHLRAALADPRVRIRANETNEGFGRAVNRGATDTTAPYVLVLNSDASMQSGAVAALVADLDADHRLGVVAPLVLGPDGHTPQVDAYGTFPSLRVLAGRTNRHPSDEDGPDWVSGVAFLGRRRALDDVGWFDRRFVMYLEDVDLCRRLRAAGWGIRRDQRVAVVHLGGASRRSNRDQDAAYHRSLVHYLRAAGYPPWEVRSIQLLHPVWQAGRRWQAADLTRRARRRGR
jgi:GT2 family glycosyltransferase